MQREKRRPNIRFDILSLFPAYFSTPFSTSIIKRAQDKGFIEINLVDIRSFAEGRYGQVDDRPYGGGPGMVLMAEPVMKAIRSVKKDKAHVIFLSPQGKRLHAAQCASFAKKEHIVLLCGHYEGVDERALQLGVDEEVSIGDYVLTGGEPAAIVFVDAVIRFIPGVIGHDLAVCQDSFEKEGLFDAPAYTRPAVFEGLEVPPVLREGNHRMIQCYREQKALEKTQCVRPDLAHRFKQEKES